MKDLRLEWDSNLRMQGADLTIEPPCPHYTVALFKNQFSLRLSSPSLFYGGRPISKTIICMTIHVVHYIQPREKSSIIISSIDQMHYPRSLRGQSVKNSELNQL